ncbi:MAG: hypothetical protein A2086_17295 [Spirochaetes bacterium GWD1_27_9]|nr:MAG: hypothetical protein A2Z98_12460 [Spirochaetes bacterium GWB1_27_13]OHD42476.1 MAG: hypothetical protein A2086_17295 [Spirochaetes bacterium GWD1_27_9]
MNKKEKISKSVQKLRNEIKLAEARAIAKQRRTNLNKVLEKDKFETHGDIYDFFMGLTSKQKQHLAFCYLYSEANFGSPKELYERFKDNKKVKK